MCANYEPVTSNERLLATFGVACPEDVRVEVWPLHRAPFIHLSEDGRRICEAGHFGLLPQFAKELSFGRKTYNARCETVHEKPSYRVSWRQGLRCVIPAERIFEPYYPPEGGKPVRWAIRREGQLPMAIAGIYKTWTGPDGQAINTFAMLTVNADVHPVMRRFNAPGEEKRMVVILDDHEIDEWLSCKVQDAARYFKAWAGPLEAHPAPKT
jgi:putative SOS response-associated peptidase YedK